MADAKTIYETLRTSPQSKSTGHTLSDGSFMAFCPNHPDQHPSLHITQKDPETVLVSCKAGCIQTGLVRKLRDLGIAPDSPRTAHPPLPPAPRPTAAVIEIDAPGAQVKSQGGDKRTEGKEWVRAIPATTPPPPTGNSVAQWCYLDAEGRAFMYVLRYPPKKAGERKRFLPWSLWRDQQTGQAEWISVDPPGNHLLYGLRELATRPTAPVLVVEGEKACDAARKLFPGYVCVTWPHGSGSVKVTDWTPLSGRDVTIWPDNDEPGARAAAEIVKQLAGAKVVTNLDAFPAKWDLADTPPQGVDVRAILETAKAPQAKPAIELVSAAELGEREYAPMTWYVEGLIPEGTTLLIAPDKVGKTNLALQALNAVARGVPELWGRRVKKAGVLYMDMEMGERLMTARLKDAGYHTTKGLDFAFKPKLPTGEAFTLDPAGLEWLYRVFSEHPEKQVLCIDTLSCVWPYTERRGHANVMIIEKGMTQAVQDLFEKRLPGRACIIIHHTNKWHGKGGETHDSLNGTRGLSSGPDWVMDIKRSDKDPNEFILTAKGRAGVGCALKMKKAGLRWECEGAVSAVNLSGREQDVTDALSENGHPMSPAELREAIQPAMSKPQLSNVCRRLLQKGVLIKDKCSRFMLSEWYEQNEESEMSEQSERSEQSEQAPPVGCESVHSSQGSSHPRSEQGEHTGTKASAPCSQSSLTLCTPHEKLPGGAVPSWYDVSSPEAVEEREAIQAECEAGQ